MALPLPISDATELTAAALAGDDEALSDVLALHHQAAYNVAYRLLGREADACDAVQEGFLHAVRAIRGEAAPPRESNRFRAWLQRIVANVALDQLRRRASFRVVAVDEVAEALPGPDHAEPARSLERREVRGDVLRALLSLPDAQRAALTLREFQELSYDEIGAMLGMSRTAVAQLLLRARESFRAAYEGLEATPRPIGCPELAPLISAMLDGELGTEAWRKLRDHLGGCARCRCELAELRRVRRLHGLIPFVAPSLGWQSAR